MSVCFWIKNVGVKEIYFSIPVGKKLKLKLYFGVLLTLISFKIRTKYLQKQNNHTITNRLRHLIKEIESLTLSLSKRNNKK